MFGTICHDVVPGDHPGQRRRSHSTARRLHGGLRRSGIYTRAPHSGTQFSAPPPIRSGLGTRGSAIAPGRAGENREASFFQGLPALSGTTLEPEFAGRPLRPEPWPADGPARTVRLRRWPVVARLCGAAGTVCGLTVTPGRTPGGTLPATDRRFAVASRRSRAKWVLFGVVLLRSFCSLFPLCAVLTEPAKAHSAVRQNSSMNALCGRECKENAELLPFGGLPKGATIHGLQRCR